MRVGLIDVDHHNFPNIAQMKIASWHKGRGDEVVWYDPFTPCDIVYKSKVFTFSPDYNDHIMADEVVKGGTGYDCDKPLPYAVEHSMPDYSMYGIKDTAYGFLTRGCPRGCDFCIVGDKEGRVSRKVADLDEFWNGQKNIVLCDPNILACSEWTQLLGQLARSGAWVDFNQGLDVRIMTRERAEALGDIKIREIHFAWDRYEQRDQVLAGLETYMRHARRVPSPHSRIVYTLVNFNTTIEQDLDRIYTLRDMGWQAYVMVYDKDNADKKYRRLSRWCNNRFVFAKCPDFADYR